MKMFIPSFRLLRGLLRRENTVRRVVRPAARSFRPSLEELEARWVPCVATCGGAVCGGGGNTSITSNCNGGGGDNQGYTSNCNGGGGCTNQGYTITCNGNNCGHGWNDQGNSCGHGSYNQGNGFGHGWTGPGNGCGHGSSGQGGCSQSVTLSGVVYYDTAGAGIYSPSDSGLSGVTVTLTGTTTSGASVSESVTTNGSGDFSFGNVAPGAYTITYTAVSGYETEAVAPSQLSGNETTTGTTTTQGVVSGIAVTTSNVTLDLPEVLPSSTPPPG